MQQCTDAQKGWCGVANRIEQLEFDTYVFRTLAATASARGACSYDAINKTNAYEKFLDGMEWLGNHNVPDNGRVCFCSYKFANYLKQDSAFMRYGDKSQEMLEKGVIGEVDGCKIVKVPASRLPAGAAFIITHKIAATAPKQLEDYKIHDNPPGISGWLVEGRMIYDCFVLNEKADAIYYHGKQAVLKTIVVTTAGTNALKSTIIVPAELEGANRMYATADSAENLPTVTYGAAPGSDFTVLNGNSVEITPDTTDTVVRVVEVDAAGNVIAVGDAVLNIGG